jgi:hypothetical protein
VGSLAKSLRNQAVLVAGGTLVILALLLSGLSPAQAAPVTASASSAAVQSAVAPKALLASSTSSLSVFRNSHCKVYHDVYHRERDVCAPVVYRAVAGHPAWFDVLQVGVRGTPCSGFSSSAFYVHRATLFDPPVPSGPERWIGMNGQHTDCYYMRTLAHPVRVHSGSGWAALLVDFNIAHINKRNDPENFGVVTYICRPSWSGCGAHLN